MIVVTQQNDMVDALCRKVYGTERGTVELVYAANPGLADHGPVLPEDVKITFPDRTPSAAAPPLATQDLWE